LAQARLLCWDVPSLMGRPLRLLLVVGLLGGAAWISQGAMGSVFGTVGEETPKFEVLRSGEGYEVRRYAACTAVETTGSNPAEDNKSFGRLAKFIGVFGSPENAAVEKIAMTAPVVTFEGGSGTRMQFILPAGKHGVAPQPTDSQVQIVERPSGMVFAVQGFSGSWSHAEAAERAAALKEKLEQDGLQVDQAQPWQFFRYNPPWTLPMLRTNEVAVPLKGL